MNGYAEHTLLCKFYAAFMCFYCVEWLGNNISQGIILFGACSCLQIDCLLLHVSRLTLTQLIS